MRFSNRYLKCLVRLIFVFDFEIWIKLMTDWFFETRNREFQRRLNAMIKKSIIVNSMSESTSRLLILRKMTTYSIFAQYYYAFVVNDLFHLLKLHLISKNSNFTRIESLISYLNLVFLRSRRSRAKVEWFLDVLSLVLKNEQHFHLTIAKNTYDTDSLIEDIWFLIMIIILKITYVAFYSSTLSINMRWFSSSIERNSTEMSLRSLTSVTNILIVFSRHHDSAKLVEDEIYIRSIKKRRWMSRCITRSINELKSDRAQNTKRRIFVCKETCIHEIREARVDTLNERTFKRHVLMKLTFTSRSKHK